MGTPNLERNWADKHLRVAPRPSTVQASPAPRRRGMAAIVLAALAVAGAGALALCDYTYGWPFGVLSHAPVEITVARRALAPVPAPLPQLPAPDPVVIIEEPAAPVAAAPVATGPTERQLRERRERYESALRGLRSLEEKKRAVAASIAQYEAVIAKAIAPLPDQGGKNFEQAIMELISIARQQHDPALGRLEMSLVDFRAKLGENRQRLAHEQSVMDGLVKRIASAAKERDDNAPLR